MGQLKEEFLEAEADLAEARRKLRETEMESFKKAREGFEEELSKTKMELAATEHLLANYQKEAVTFDTGMQSMERQIDGKPGIKADSPTFPRNGPHALTKMSINISIRRIEQPLLRFAPGVMHVSSFHHELGTSWL